VVKIHSINQIKQFELKDLIRDNSFICILSIPQNKSDFFLLLFNNE